MGCESAKEKKHLKNSALHIQQVKLTQSENAILLCKSCRDKIKKLLKNQYLFIHKKLIILKNKFKH